jgi:chemotaxis response regulator CheB
MRELVLATLADQPDIEVVGEVREHDELADIVEQALPDVLVLALDRGQNVFAQIGFLLGRHPRMRILALAPEENRGAYYWAIVDIRSKPLESSEASILSAVRERPVMVGEVVS